MNYEFIFVKDFNMLVIFLNFFNNLFGEFMISYFYCFNYGFIKLF